MLAYTLVALAPPYLAKLAIDEGISTGDLSQLQLARRALPRLSRRRAAALVREHVPDRLGEGERVLADLRNKLFRHLRRLSLGFYERNRAG